MRSIIAVGFVSIVSVVGCVGGEEDVASDSSDVKGADSGTKLTASSSAGTPVCQEDGTSLAPITATLVSSASAAWAEVTLSIDGGATSTIDEVLPTDYSKDGRTKTYSYTYDIALAAGSHDLQICFSQPSGKTRMVACTTVHVEVAACTSGSVCEKEGLFGWIQGNGNLCAGNAQGVNIHAKGDFGDDPALTISGPNGFTHNATLDHAGDSCVYHYQWANETEVAGDYTFTITGGGNTKTFAAKLFCK
jgi:hypothetical protein